PRRTGLVGRGAEDPCALSYRRLGVSRRRRGGGWPEPDAGAADRCKRATIDLLRARSDGPRSLPPPPAIPPRHLFPPLPVPLVDRVARGAGARRPPSLRAAAARNPRGISHRHRLGDSLLVGRLADLGAAVPTP